MFYQLSHPATVDYFALERGQNFNFPAHMHHCFELITVTKGQMTVGLDDKNYTLSAGQSIFIFPHQVHTLHSKESRHLLCIFSPRLVSAYSKKVTHLKPSDPTLTLSDSLTAALGALANDASLFAKKGFLYALCALFDEKRHYQPWQSDSQKLLERIFAFIESNFSGECNLKSLARALRYDYAYLSRYFKRTVGLSFLAYVNMYRIDHACYLLENTQLSILECALESGFTSIRSFNRNFKEYLGQTPRQFLLDLQQN